MYGIFGCFVKSRYLCKIIGVAYEISYWYTEF